MLYKLKKKKREKKSLPIE